MFGKKKAYLDNTPRPERLLMLDHHPSQRRTDLRAQKRLSLSHVHAKFRAWPQRDVRFAAVLVHKSFQNDRPSGWVLDVERQHILEPRDLLLSFATELGVLEEHDVRILSEWHDFAFDVVGLSFVAGREDVVGDYEAGFDIDGLVGGSFRCLLRMLVLRSFPADGTLSPVKLTTNFVPSASTA